MSPSHDSFIWYELMTTDQPAAEAFYRKVVGWTSSEVPMGGYSDYCMNQPSTGATVAGICHARGANEGIPPQWLIYITVPDVAAAAAAVRANGGTVIREPRSAGGMGTFCIIRDPAGAIAALYQSA